MSVVDPEDTKKRGTFKKLEYEWEPLTIDGLSHDEIKGILRRGREILESWNETPYMPGQRAKGIGVDCARFATAVYDELYGFDRLDSRECPQDAAMHAPDTAVAAVELLMGAYAPCHFVDTVQPFDAVIIAPKDGGPGHTMIAGTKTKELWHAIASGRWVRKTGWAVPWSYDVWKVVRMGDREKWAR